MSNSFSISEAFESLLKTSNSLNIVAVVSKQSIVQSSPSSVSLPRAELWVSDSSLPEGKSARVSLYGLTDASRVAEDNIVHGDILRFNHVSLSKASSRQTIHFVQSKHQPGADWYRLGHIERDGKISSKPQNVPPSMLTSETRLQELAQWFHALEENIARPVALLQRPCRRRTLAEIQSSVGLTTSVVVKVSDYFVRKVRYPSLKRKRCETRVHAMGFARLSDTSGSVSFVDPAGRFGATLQLAQDNRKSLLFTHVVTKSPTEVHAQHSIVDNEVVLVPTSNSEVMILPAMAESTQPASIVIDVDSQLGPIVGNTATVVSSIEDIVIDGVSVKAGGALESLPGFLSTVLRGGKRYQSATICLRPNREFTASPLILQALCGDLEPAELSQEDDTVCSGAFTGFCHLIHKNIKLQWEVDLSDHPESIISVGLLGEE